MYSFPTLLQFGAAKAPDISKTVYPEGDKFRSVARKEASYDAPGAFVCIWTKRRLL